MTHPLLANFDRMLSESKFYPNVPKVYTDMIRDLIETIIERHGGELWGRNQIMTAPVVLLRGSESETIEARTRKLAVRVGETEIEAAKYDRQGIIDTLVEQIMGEFRAELGTHPTNPSKVTNFHPYQLLTPSGLVIDPDTMKPSLSLLTRYGISSQHSEKPAVETPKDDDDGQALIIAIT